MIYGRRNALRLTAIGATSLVLLGPGMLATNADAFLGILLRFLLRGALRRGTMSSLRTTLRLARAARTAHTVSKALSDTHPSAEGLHQSFLPARIIQDMGVDSGHVTQVARQIVRLCDAAKAKALWVQGRENTFDLLGENTGNDSASGSVLIHFNDLLAGRVCSYRYGTLLVPPGESFSLSLEAPPDFEGRVFSISGEIPEDQRIAFRTSPPVVMAKTNEAQLERG